MSSRASWAQHCLTQIRATSCMAVIVLRVHSDETQEMTIGEAGRVSGPLWWFFWGGKPPYIRGGQPVREQEPRFLSYYRKEPHHTHGHTWMSRHLFLTRTQARNQGLGNSPLPKISAASGPAHTCLCSARFIVNITHRHQLQAIYCNACYLVELMAFLVLNYPLRTWLILSHGRQSEQFNALISRVLRESHVKPGKESHAYQSESGYWRSGSMIEWFERFSLLVLASRGVNPVL